VKKTEATTNLVVQDGQTILIGGLVREDISAARSGIPYLSKIPLLGYLFGSTTDENHRKELIILLTPRVIKNQHDARKATSSYVDDITKTGKGKLKKEELIRDIPGRRRTGRMMPARPRRARNKGARGNAHRGPVAGEEPAAKAATEAEESRERQDDNPSLSGRVSQGASCHGRIATRFIRENRIIPFEWKDGTLKIIMADPSRRELVDALRAAPQSDVLVHTGDPAVIDEHISRFYSKDQQNLDKIIEGIDEREGYEFIRDEEEEDVGHLKDLASEAPIIRLVNLFITRAVELRASDIHIEPFEDEMKIRYRIDGVLNDVESTPKRLQAAIVSRIKIMARLNIAERRLPQDGRIRLRVGEKEIAIRVSTIPIVNGESVVMRLLDRESIVIDLASLGFSQAMLMSLDRLITKPNGIILVTGPTGSGKTTTLYGALDKINSPEKKIITVEDPVEYQLKGVNQIQVKPQIGLDFNSTLRHIVRQDRTLS
jgi:hypothetical protein